MDVRLLLPDPRLFFPAALIWTALTMALWYAVARDLGPALSLGGLVGYVYPPADANAAPVEVETARNIWLFQYMFALGVVFCVAVGMPLPHCWSSDQRRTGY